MRRASAALITAALLVTGLSACSSGPAAGCSAPVSSGDASALISATGTFGSAPKVSIPTPVKTDTTQRSELIQGSGAVVHKNQKIIIDATILNGTTGETITKTAYDEKTKTPIVLNKQTIAGLTKGLQCTTVGSRVAIAISPKDGFGDQGNAQIGIGKDDALVAVVDVERAYPMKATGTPVAHTPGFPSVVLAPNGAPGISITKHGAPKSEKVALLKQGHGKTVKKGESVTVNYTGVFWSQNAVSNSTWKANAPASVLTGDDPQGQNQVPAGFVKAIIGKKVGSQVIAVVPPGKGKDAAMTDTVVYVIDVLGID